MRFSDVIGQENVKARLRSQVDGERLPHALMLCGPLGTGKLGLALALSRYMLCEHPHDGEPCEECHACKMTAEWAHPDLHFTFPVFKKKDGDHPLSDDYMQPWREQLKENIYFDQNDWLARMGGENQQLRIFVNESDALQQKLGLKSSQGGRRVVVLWMPEKMGEDTANKLLKLIEEPPSRTHFLLVSQQPDQVLGTIMSRTQQLHVPVLGEEEILQALKERHALPDNMARNLAHMAQGSYTRALHQMKAGSDEKEFFELFVSLMRLSYMRKIKDMREWSDHVAKMGRERQKNLLDYCQRMVRENFVYNFGQQDKLNYLTQEENDFSTRFARFINEHNVVPIMNALSDCQRDIEQNVNAKMVFFDFAIKLIILLKQ